MSEIIEINVGDTVKSFDFPETTRDLDGKKACFVEGVVEEIGRLLDWQSCDVYKIKCTKKVFSGEEIEQHEEFYYVPVNGTNTWLGGKTDGVIKA
jgi:hypothetical protein